MRSLTWTILDRFSWSFLGGKSIKYDQRESSSPSGRFVPGVFCRRIASSERRVCVGCPVTPGGASQAVLEEPQRILGADGCLATCPVADGFSPLAGRTSCFFIPQTGSLPSCYYREQKHWYILIYTLSDPEEGPGRQLITVVGGSM